jgi:hypothetical protein
VTPEPPAPKFPGVVLAAGIVWIVLGGIILYQGVAGLVLFADDTARIGGVADQPLQERARGFGASLVLFGGAFILAGILSVLGAATDTLGKGIGSILTGVFVAVMVGGPSLDIRGGGIGVGLVVAGLLALVGRSEYLAWRKSQTEGPGRTGRCA